MSLFHSSFVSATGYGAVRLTLQGIDDGIREDLRSAGVALHLHAGSDCVSVDHRGSGIALNLDAARDIISVHRYSGGVTGNLKATFDDVAAADLMLLRLSSYLTFFIRNAAAVAAEIECC